MATNMCSHLGWFQKCLIVFVIGITLLIPGIVMTVVGKGHLDQSGKSLNAMIVIGPIFLVLGGLSIVLSSVALALHVLKRDSELSTNYTSEAPPMPPPIDGDMLPPSNEDSDRAFHVLGEFSPGALPDNDIQGPTAEAPSSNSGPFDLGNSLDMQPSPHAYTNYANDYQKY